MAKIDAFRMLGRIDNSIEYLMGKYNLALSENIPDYPTLLLALSTHVNLYDRGFCLRMAEAAVECLAQTESTTLNQFEADQQRNIGVREARYIFSKHADGYADKILADHDYLEDIEAERKRKKREARRNTVLTLAIIVVFIAGIIIYNLPYFAEQREFAKVEKEFDNGSLTTLDLAVEDYIRKYPDGKHFSDVAYMPVKLVRKGYDAIQVLDAVDNYLQHDPNGPYAKECKVVSDSIWDVEIKKYETKAGGDASAKGAEFVIDMLHYMKANNVRTVGIIPKPALNVKEIVEYPSEVVFALEESYRQSSSFKIPEDVVPVKGKITIGKLNEWVHFIVSALQTGFDEVLTPGFITFEEINDSNRKLAEKWPKVTVDFSVSNQEMKYHGYTFPEIWTSQYSYTTSDNMILGIAMKYKATFALPGVSKDYVVTEQGDPGEATISASSSSDAYETMCERCTVKFAEKISDEFGLDEFKSASNNKSDK